MSRPATSSTSSALITNLDRSFGNGRGFVTFSTSEASGTSFCTNQFWMRVGRGRRSREYAGRRWEGEGRDNPCHFALLKASRSLLASAFQKRHRIRCSRSGTGRSATKHQGVATTGHDWVPPGRPLACINHSFCSIYTYFGPQPTARYDQDDAARHESLRLVVMRYVRLPAKKDSTR